MLKFSLVLGLATCGVGAFDVPALAQDTSKHDATDARITNNRFLADLEFVRQLNSENVTIENNNAATEQHK